MDINDKRLLLAEHLDEFRKWTYETLAAEIERTENENDCLRHTEGTFVDGTEYQIEFNVFWDDRRGGDVRVCADLTTEPQCPTLGFLPIYTPDVTDSFIMRRDGSFVGG